MYKILTFVLLSLVSINALSQSFLDTGKFAVVHKDGHVTSKVFRVINENNKWRVEDKKKNGKWEDVTCQIDCILSASSTENINQYFDHKVPENTDVECIHNQAFAFCTLKKYSEKTSVLIAFTPTKLVHLKLKKLAVE